MSVKTRTDNSTKHWWWSSWMQWFDTRSHTQTSMHACTNTYNIHTCAHHTYIHTCPHMCTHIPYTNMTTYILAHTHTRTYTMRSCTLTQTKHIYTHTHIHIMHTRPHTHAHTQHTHTHTHTTCMHACMPHALHTLLISHWHLLNARRQNIPHNILIVIT